MMILGVDISNNNGAVDFGALAADGVRFVIHKATEGVGYMDRFVVGNWASMKDAGLVRGLYHYARPDLSDPQSEADYFCSVVEGLGLEPGDLVALDFEDPPPPAQSPAGDLSGWALHWLDAVTARLGFRPGLYSFPYFMQHHKLTGNARLAEYWLWYASWRDDMPSPPPSWPVISVWQYTSSLAVSGVAGKVDGNWFNGDDLDRLRALGKPADSPAYIVGPGIVAAMERAHERPASHERYLKDAHGEDVLSVAAGDGGGLFLYFPDTDGVYRVQKT